jgi:hypothetical protein
MFFSCDFLYIFRRRVFKWWLVSQSAPYQKSVVLLSKTDDFQVSRFSAKWPKNRFSSGISLQKREEFMIKITSEKWCQKKRKNNEKCGKIDAKMKCRKKEPPKSEFSGLFVDFGEIWAPTGGAKSTENRKSAAKSGFQKKFEKTSIWEAPLE